ncbi:hypothetical protein DFP72DRAFT_759499, partial [Ephemerocybe angulata]
ISTDLKEAMLRLKSRKVVTLDDIERIGQLSTRTLYRAQRLYRLTGSASPPPAVGRGRPRTLLQADCDYLVQLARHSPSTFLDKYRDRL